MRHSDKQTKFETGAQRDTTEGKGSPSLISPVLIHRTGVHLEKGAEHYGPDNWRAGMPFRRTADSMIRHIYQWLAGDEVEDHLAAIVCNAMFLMHWEEDLKAGNLPRSLDDRADHSKRILDSLLTSGKPETKVKPEPREITGRCRQCGSVAMVLLLPGVTSWKCPQFYCNQTNFAPKETPDLEGWSYCQCGTKLSRGFASCDKCYKKFIEEKKSDG